MTLITRLRKTLLSRTALQRLFGNTVRPRQGSKLITDQSIIDAFKNDPYNTFLVSFPRTGSHWLRMLMELYFGRPSLVRVFYYPNRDNYLTLHTHDLDLSVERSRVIYLYRDPVDTIYSQLRYYKETLDDLDRIGYWTDLYGQHLDKWLHKEKFTEHKTFIRYERLKKIPRYEFRKICTHFSKSINIGPFELAISRVSKEHVKQKTVHDPQVINLTRNYVEERRRFLAKQGDFIWQVLLKGRERLREHF